MKPDKKQLYDVVAVGRWTGKRRVVAKRKHYETAMYATVLWKQHYPGLILTIVPVTEEKRG